MMPEQQYDYSDPEVAIARVDSLKCQLTKTYKELYKSRELVAQRDTTIKELHDDRNTQMRKVNNLRETISERNDTITEMRELLEEVLFMHGGEFALRKIRDYLNKTK